MLTPDAGPRVSIVIPVFNGADYLREAVESALAQTYRNVEVLVVNDGSRDAGATEAIARSYGDRIRYLAKENGGVASALNAGIAAMSGEYFSWLSHDDVYKPHKVEVQVSLLAPGAPPVVLYGDYEFIDATGRRIGERRISTRGRPMRVALIGGDPVNGCTVLVPRACFAAAGSFDERLRSFQDYDMWFRLARRFPFVHVPSILLSSRIHPAQGTRTLSGHYAECSRELAHMVEALEPDELRNIAPKDPSSLYTALALNLKLRGFDEPARTALALARKTGAGAPRVSRLRRAAVTAACAVLTRKMNPAYWLARARSALRSGAPSR